MLFEEFQKLTNCNDYDVYNQFNALYMAADMDKKDFCRAVRPVVASIMEVKRQEINRLVRVRVDRCPNGNDVYGVYIKKNVDIASGRARLQFTGYIGIGTADFFKPFFVEPGLADMTRAEIQDVALWDCNPVDTKTYKENIERYL